MGSVLPKPICEDGSVENFSLIWIDGDVNSAENIKAQETVRQTINQLTTFTSSDDCIKYIRNRSINDRIVLISSGALGRTAVPLIHELRQVFSIYIYCRQKDYHLQWSRNFVKVRGVFVVLNELIERILFDQKVQKYKVDEQLSISVFNTEYFAKKLEVDSYEHFIYSQLLINCLLQLQITDKEKSELYALCRTEYETNKTAIGVINEFIKKYSENDAIRWFTRDCFLYKMLIKALQIQNLDLLFLLRFVIRDIQKQIEQNPISSNIEVYRSQLMTKSELQKLKDSFGQFISVNSFLSSIQDRAAAIAILNNSSVSYEIERVLFEIRADGRPSGVKPFTNIKSKSFNDQDEILFSIGSIFQLNDISYGKENVWIIKMTLCTNNNNELQPLFKYINEQYGNMNSRLDTFGVALEQMLKFEEAEKFYHRVAAIQSLNPLLIAECKKKLERIPIDKENYDRQMSTYDQTFKATKINGYYHASNYIQKGDEYRKQGDVNRALELYNKALHVLTKSYGNNHQEVGRCHSKIGCVHEDNENYQEALQHYENARQILEQHLPRNHPELSEIYGRIGDMYQNIQNYDQALANYDRSLEIAKNASISQLPSIISIMNKIASIYEKKRDFRQALTYYEKLAEVLPENHIHADENNLNIERVRKLIK